jgi:hypothetical protein
MIDLKPIEDEINELSKRLQQKRNALKEAKESNLEEQYGEGFGCYNCAYGCCVDVLDYHTCCTKGKCIHCQGRCAEYMPDNILSIYIRDKHYYDKNMLDALNDLFDVLDIMQKPELHGKAFNALMLMDGGEKKDESN